MSVDPNGDGQTDRQHGPCATTECEVERGNENDWRGRPEGAGQDGTAAVCKADRQERPQSGEEPDRIPVPEWLVEPVAGDRIERAPELRGEESRGESISAREA